MARWKWFNLVVLLLLVLGLGCQKWADYCDKQALRKHFGLPSGVRMTEYQGFPAVGGTFQREGLRVTAAFLFTPRQAAEYRIGMQAAGWRKLPLPPDILKEAQHWPALVNHPQLKARNGWYLLKTAGDNVLYNRGARVCDSARELKGDLILGIFTLPDNRLYAVVESGY